MKLVWKMSKKLQIEDESSSLMHEPVNYQRDYVIPPNTANPFVNQAQTPVYSMPKLQTQYAQPTQPTQLAQPRDMSGLDILRNSYF